MPVPYAMLPGAGAFLAVSKARQLLSESGHFWVWICGLRAKVIFFAQDFKASVLNCEVGLTWWKSGAGMGRDRHVIGDHVCAGSRSLDLEEFQACLLHASFVV